MGSIRTLALILAGLCLCLSLAAPAQAKIEKASWGETADHQKVDIYTLTNARGMSARITGWVGEPANDCATGLATI